MIPLFGVYGASGCGRGIMPLLRSDLAEANARLVFIDDAPLDAHINGQAVLAFEEFILAEASSRHVAIAIANSKVRETLDRRCTAAGVEVIGTRARNVVIMDDVQIGAGALLSPFVTVTSNIRIGRCFHANLYSYVEHDCLIGDYVTFAPGVHCNGNVSIGDHAYIGAGAVIRQGLSVGAGATVGMGAVVTKNVPAGATVAGNPAKPLNEN